MKTLFTMNRKKDILLALLLTVFIISFAICFTVFFKPLYYFDIDFLNISGYTGIDKDIIMKNYDILIQYQSLFFKGDLVLPDFIMSETGRIHFVEVKRIFETVQILCVVSAILSSIMIYKNIIEKEYRFLKLTSLFSVGIPSIIGLLACADFDSAFVIFHKIFFRNDYWIFDYRTDPIITVLPQDFFMHCFLLIISLVIALSLLCFALYKMSEKKILRGE